MVKPHRSAVVDRLVDHLIGLVLGLFGRLLQPGGGLVGAALVLQLLIAGSRASGLLRAPLELFSLVRELVINAHDLLLICAPSCQPQPACALLGPGGPVEPGRRYRCGDRVAGARARTAVAARAPIRSRVTRHCAQRLLSGHFACTRPLSAGASTCSRRLLSGHSTCLCSAACPGPRPAVCAASSHKYCPPRPPAACLFR